MNLKRIFVISTALVALGLAPKLSNAQQVKIGGHVGALGVGESGTIGYGGQIAFFPYDTLGLLVNGTYGRPNDSGFFYGSPSLVFYFATPEELKLGGLIGGGFYKASNVDAKFGIDYGLIGDFMLSPTVSVGTEARFHSIFDSDDAWNIFLTFNFTFSAGDGW
jgi:hypothetical protein